MFKKQKEILILASFIFVTSIFTSLFIQNTTYADYTAQSNGGSCKAGDTEYDGTTTPGTTAPTKMCKTASTDPAQSSGTAGVTDDNAKGSACAIDKIGWLLCPVMEKVAVISDKAFDVLADNFLQTDAQLVSDTVSGHTNGTKIAWDIARNFANIMFVIAFLVIIISQVTGFGISNYGIKKMIPRLIVAAITVNISYYICQLAVDLSNILGYEIEHALTDISNTVGPSVFGTISNYSDSQVNNGLSGAAATATESSGILFVIVAAALASAALVWIMLPTILSIVPLILITVVTIIIILLLRKALIVLLVVISPIAFVLYLLPNTERLFSRWMKMFTQLLMVFPIVGLLFGAGQLASTIILVAGASDGNASTSAACSTNASGTTTPASNSTAAPTSNTSTATPATNSNALGSQCEGMISAKGGKGTSSCTTSSSISGTACNAGSAVHAKWTVGLIATGVAVAPLLAVWAVLKGALSAAGAIGGKISGAVEKGVSRAGNAGVGKPLDIGAKALQGRINANTGARWQNMQAKALERDKKTGDGSLVGNFAKRRALRNARLAGSKSDLENLERQAVLDSEGSYASGFSSHGQQQAERAAKAADEKHVSEEIQAASLTARNLDNGGLRAVVDGSVNANDPEVAAAIKELIKRQDFEGIEKALDKFGSAKDSVAARVLGSDLESTGMFTGGQLGDISRGAASGSYASMVTGNLENGILSADKIATSGPGVLEEASRMATSQKAMQSLINSAHAAVNDPILSKKISRNAGTLDNFSKGNNAQGVKW